MRRFRAMAFAAAVVVAAVPARSDAPLPAMLQVLGTVTNAAQPVANALVIALNLQDFNATQTWTTRDGTFSLPSLRNGVYKIIAVKQGFVPAITTIVPTRPSHRVALKLENEKNSAKSGSDEIWELRGSLPSDVLRELDNVLQPVAIASYEIPRFRGEMMSMTGVASNAASPAFAQTALGVQGRIGENWQVGVRGNVRRFEDPTDEVRFGAPVAESSVMSMEVRSSPADAVRVASTRSSWMYAGGSASPGPEADFQAHNIEWEHGDAHVQVRYFEQANLFRNAPENSNVVEIAGDTTLLQTRRNDLGVALRVTQESVGRGGGSVLRAASVSANGSVAVVPSLLLQYGMASRLGIEGQELAPRTGVAWKLGKNSSVIASALYKVLDRGDASFVLPTIADPADQARDLPRYSYTFGFVTGHDGKNRFSAVATVTGVDSPLRLVFADSDDPFWDGLYVDAGEVRRDVRVAWRREIGSRFAVDVATSAGTAGQPQTEAAHVKYYVTGDLQSTFSPTGTALLISYREIEQPRDAVGYDYRTERFRVRMAQSLYLPIDMKLLLGMELARAENSPYLIDTLTPEGTSKKYLGGLSVNF